MKIWEYCRLRNSRNKRKYLFSAWLATNGSTQTEICYPVFLWESRIICMYRHSRHITRELDWWLCLHDRSICVFLGDQPITQFLSSVPPPSPSFLFPGHMSLYLMCECVCVQQHSCACLHMHVCMCPYLEEVLIRLCSWVKYEELGDFIKVVEWWSSSQLTDTSDFSLFILNINPTKTIHLRASLSFTLSLLLLISVFHFTMLCGKLMHTVYVSACFVPVCVHNQNRRDREGNEIESR